MPPDKVQRRKQVVAAHDILEAAAGVAVVAAAAAANGSCCCRCRGHGLCCVGLCCCALLGQPVRPYVPQCCAYEGGQVGVTQLRAAGESPLDWAATPAAPTTRHTAQHTKAGTAKMSQNT